MYENGKMRPVETIPGMGGEEIKENGGGVNSGMIYCKNFYKCHNVPQYNSTIIIKNKVNTLKNKFPPENVPCWVCLAEQTMLTLPLLETPPFLASGKPRFYSCLSVLCATTGAVFCQLSFHYFILLV
jgi:hypothetical protein